ncbi:MAG: hypothetical protein SOI38_01095 [Eggerthellaceae bacterium]|jgi:hypothetical protein
MITTFNDKERAAMHVMGLPEDIDEFFDNGPEFVDESRTAIKDELLGPGLEDNGMDLNPYGEALRSALDAITNREWELEHQQ